VFITVVLTYDKIRDEEEPGLQVQDVKEEIRLVREPSSFMGQDNGRKKGSAE